MYCPWLRRGWGQVRDCAIGGGAIATTHMVTVNWIFVAFFRVDEPSSLARQRRHRHLPLHHRTNCRKWADRLKGDLTLGRGSGCGNAGQDGARGGSAEEPQNPNISCPAKWWETNESRGPETEIGASTLVSSNNATEINQRCMTRPWEMASGRGGPPPRRV